MQKARRHFPKEAPTACKHTVSGTVSLPSQGFFSPFPHGTSSLSVAGEYLALGDGPPKFPQDSSCPVVLGNLTKRDNPFAYRTFTFYGYPFQDIQLKLPFVTLRPCRARIRSGPSTPLTQRTRAITCMRFGLFPVRSPLLGESRLFSFPPGTEMVHFPGFASTPYVFR